MGLSVGSATASAVVSAIPDDTCTPIANQLAGISKDFGIIVGVILLEKYLLTTLGFVLFGILVPVSCLGLAVATLLPDHSHAKEFLFSGTVRILIVGVVLWGSIPASVFLTDKIEETYEASISAALNSADEAAAVSELISDDNEPDEKADDENIIVAAYHRVRDFFCGPSEAISDLTGKAAELVGWAQTALSNFIEGLAVMAVTTCVIPILVPLFGLWVIKLLFLSPLHASS